jgi:outer membrane receptor for ferrienterochelin and colicins
VSDNQAEIPFANIEVKEAKVGTSADAKGYFKLEAPAGNYSIEVTAMGYHKFKKKIQLIEGETFFIDLVLVETSYSIDQVVVTGTLKESFVKVSPVKVEVITSAFLKKTPTNNIMEIIETVNGVQKQINCGVCGTSDIHINGMEGPYSLILIDGMPIMSSLSTVYGLNGIPTSLIKQIEIIKGPSSTLYGTEAVAGVINIITKRPEDLSKLMFESFLSSDREKNMDLSWSPKWKKVDMLLSANLFHMNHFMDENGDGFADEVLSERISLFNKWSFHRVSGKAMDFTAKYYFEERFGGIESWTQV